MRIAFCFFSSFFLMWTACDHSTQTCTTGQSNVCTCSTGASGSQSCEANGIWGTCQCGGGGTEKAGQETSTMDGGTSDGVSSEKVATEQPATESAPPENTEQKICFTRDILPIFQANCALSGCHDAATQKDGVNLSDYASVMASKRGRGIIAGNPNGSEVYKSMIDPLDFRRMPPPPQGRLAAELIEKIRKWIEDGAKNEPCDTNPSCKIAGLGYAKDIAPLLTRSCVGCHNPQLVSGGVRLDTYDLVKQTVSAGKFLPSIRHDAGAKPMPPQGAKLSACEIEQITQWVSGGFAP